MTGFLSTDFYSTGFLRELDDLVRENGYLRQEIVWYKESRNVMLDFHSRTRKASLLLQSTMKELFNKTTRSREAMLSYWGIKLNDVEKKDLVVLYIRDVHDHVF